MYRTAKELHIAFDTALQHIDSNRKQSISPYHKDMLLNAAVLQFIKNRANPKTNIKGEGFHESIKRYEDLKELQVTTDLLSVLVDKGTHFITLPRNYYLHVSCEAMVEHVRSSMIKPTYIETKYIYTLAFVDSDRDNSYRNLNLTGLLGTEFNQIIQSLNLGTKGKDAKFVIIPYILEALNNIDGIEAYWERYDNIYKPNSVLIVGNKYDRYHLSYDNISNSSDSITKSYYYYNIPGTSTAPISLVSSEELGQAKHNHYMMINRHLNPIGKLEGNRIIVLNGLSFIIPSLKITYIKRPTLVNHISGSVPELSFIEEVVELAVQKAKAYIKDEGYQHIVNENQLIE